MQLKFSPGSVQHKPVLTELTAQKSLIENLVQDNKMLHEDIGDFKAVLEILITKYNEMKRDLEVEKLKNTRIDLLEQQLAKEKTRKQNLLQTHLRLKERYMGLLDVMREAAFDIKDEDKEDISLFEQLNRENHKLKEMLGLLKISDPKVQEIEKALRGEDVTDQVNIEEYKETLRSYRKKKNEQKRSKSFGIVGRKNYLLMSPQEKTESSNIWDSFFNKQEKETVKCFGKR
ncbi:unnamed protein product [Blepharisma stoltei]|uniref:Uncharacterized protein n=1 Tax=Blepharisma stoltei TaxID=1481888 RepID=A0AAU9JDT3_9CILI|nr:unnamed protein product [Blepharisma stoltei]